MKLKKGITVLICTFNGAKNLPSTLKHLAQQEFKKIAVEIILVDNASVDNTAEIARKLWKELNTNIDLRIISEPRKGKDKAIDTGLSEANYQYVIICDDDNWLAKNYVQLSYQIMNENEDIGILGGQGLPAKTLNLPEWFPSQKTYYAIGKQGLISGEIKHYWPSFRFIWGAGSVINMKAYHLLMKCGFKRVLTYEAEGKIARSEDIELCYSIWLTGYKLWYDRRLIYEHALEQDRLTWLSLIHIAKISIPAYHILRPYDILIFAGIKNPPVKTYWFKYIIYSFKSCVNYFNYPKDIITICRIVFNKHISDYNYDYLMKVIMISQFVGMLKLGKKYDSNFKKIQSLQTCLNNEIKDYDRKLLERQC